jgi:P27 family predicted phage terminase small subunit
MPMKIPNPPAFLDRAAKTEYRRVAGLLAERGLLDPIRLSALEAYCAAFSRWRNAEKALIDNPDADNARELRAVIKEAMHQMRDHGRDLGLWAQTQVRNKAPEQPADHGDDDDMNAQLARALGVGPRVQ